MRHVLVPSLAMGLVLSADLARASPSFLRLDLDEGSAAFGVSADGSVVVGWDGEDLQSGFRWIRGRGVARVRGGRPIAISADGSTMVGFCGPPEEACLWHEPGTMVPLAPPDGRRSFAIATSADGSVVVGWRDCVPFFACSDEAFRWTQAEGVVPLFAHGSTNGVASGVSADGSQIVGTHEAVAFRWNAADGLVPLEPLPGGGPWTQALAISADGSTIVGQAMPDPTADERAAVRWTEAGGIESLGILPNGWAIASAVSADGSVVAGLSQFELGGDVFDAFIWDPVHGMRLLADVLQSAGVDLGGWHLDDASGVSADGRTIVGSGHDSQGVHQAFIATTDCDGLADADGDGVADRCDVCPFVANPGQEETGGVGSGSAPDTIGDACQCGDVDGNGRVTLVDAVMMQRALLDPPTATMRAPTLCDVSGDGQCTFADAVVVRRAMLEPPTASIQQSCAPANP